MGDVPLLLVLFGTGDSPPPDPPVTSRGGDVGVILGTVPFVFAPPASPETRGLLLLLVLAVLWLLLFARSAIMFRFALRTASS